MKYTIDQLQELQKTATLEIEDWKREQKKKFEQELEAWKKREKQKFSERISKEESERRQAFLTSLTTTCFLYQDSSVQGRMDYPKIN